MESLSKTEKKSTQFSTASGRGTGYSDCLFVDKTGCQLARHNLDINYQILTGNNLKLAGQVVRRCKGKILKRTWEDDWAEGIQDDIHPR